MRDSFTKMDDDLFSYCVHEISRKPRKNSPREKTVKLPRSLFPDCIFNSGWSLLGMVDLWEPLILFEGKQL